ncbi:MAG: hypothetical protein R3B83_05955 [Nitrospirales bacterium]|nr:hypothetical protein [Nitrospirales bacterium]
MPPISVCGAHCFDSRKLPGIDVPGALAGSVGTIQMSAAQNLVALNIMVRLVKNRLPLTELPKMTPKQLAETIILNAG